MAARQVLQTAADQDAAVLPRFVGIGEIHILLRQERAQMFVDLLQGSVFECFVGALLRLPLLGLVQNGPALDDLDTGELLQNPTLGGVVCELGLLRLEALIHRHHAFELCKRSADPTLRG